MRLPRFKYFEPGTIDEACALLLQPDTKVLAGGTELLVHMKQRTLRPKALVNIKSIPGLARIEPTDDGGLNIGPAATLRTVATSPLVRERFDMLAQAAASVGKPRIPELATIGGNMCLDSRCFYYNQSRLWKQSLPRCHKDGGGVCHVVKGSDHCHALFVADTVPALIALRAEVAIAGAPGAMGASAAGARGAAAGAGSERRIALEDFYTGRGEQVNLLQPGEVLTEIRLPPPLPHSANIYLKYSLREAIDFAVIGVAVVLTVEPEDGVCRDVRIVLGSVAPGPLRASETEALLRGRPLDEDLTSAAARHAAREAHPITHLGVSAGHKRKIVETLTKRAIRQAWQHATED